MPPFTTLRDFISALATGDTNITRVLEELANDAGMKSAHQADMRVAGTFDPLPSWFTDACAQHNMSPEEIQHLSVWPEQQRDSVRAQISEAWEQNRPIHFSWELHEGDNALSEVRRDQNTQDVRIVFRSPRKGVHLDSHIRIGEVKVDL